uniref:Endophilin-A2 n=1 Tax=Romanomermis culicivorax TaxID=13658 RepID=A0A915KVE8_ROMCU
MSLAGLKKQINKANQYVSERMGSAEATKLDDTYHELEKRIDITNELVDDFLAKTREYLQPNPATRAKMATAATISKLRGTTKSMPYPQPEGVLGDSMLKYGKALGDDSNFGKALIDAGETYRAMADVKYGLEDNVKQNFLDPLTHLLNNDLKEVAHHRKKLQGRRLDYDCKKRKQKDVPCDEEIRQAEEKLEESKKLAETAMFNVLDNDVEQISQLCAFVEAQLDFHKQTALILEGLSEKLKTKIQHAANRPRTHHIPKPVLNEDQRRSPVPDSPQHTRRNSQQLQPQQQAPKKSASGHTIVDAQDPWAMPSGGATGGQQHDLWSNNQAPPPYSDHPTSTNGTSAAVKKQPCCRANYDFEAENEGELSFKEGQIINLVSRIDENWFQGLLPNTGQSGYFPVSYVTVVVPLP